MVVVHENVNEVHFVVHLLFLQFVEQLDVHDLILHVANATATAQDHKDEENDRKHGAAEVSIVDILLIF